MSLELCHESYIRHWASCSFRHINKYLHVHKIIELSCDAREINNEIRQDNSVTAILLYVFMLTPPPPISKFGDHFAPFLTINAIYTTIYVCII